MNMIMNMNSKDDILLSESLLKNFEGEETALGLTFIPGIHTVIRIELLSMVKDLYTFNVGLK